ncbi:MAG: transglutaminase-like domain-containing protein [Actinomycetota bacterium]
MSPLSPTDRFAAMVADEPHRLDLGAALIAAHGDPEVDVDGLLVRLDSLASEVSEPSLDGLLDWYRTSGFRGDMETYGDPVNSFLHLVLDRRLGIPISLAVVLIEVGRRVGVPLAGVSMPGHFLVRHTGVNGLLLDPFDGARRLDEVAAQGLHARVLGDDQGFHPAYLAPVAPLDVITRMLTNLRLAYARSQDLAELVWVLRLRTMLPRVDPSERRALASVLATQGRFVDAAAELTTLADATDDPADADRLRIEARMLLAKLN